MLKPSPVVLFFSVSVSIFLVGFWFLLLPLLHQWGETQANLDMAQKSPLSSVVKTSSKALEDQQALQQQVSILLPKSDAQYDLSVQVEALSKSLGVSLTSLSLTKDEPKSGQKKVVITLGASGSYLAVQQFIQALTSLDRFVQVDQFSITNGTVGNVVLQLSAFAYYQP